MGKALQLIQISPEELETRLFLRFRNELALFKAEFHPSQPTEFLTRADVKEMLKIDLSTVHNWTKKGKLKAYGIGNRIYYCLNEIEQALKPLK